MEARTPTVKLVLGSDAAQNQNWMRLDRLLTTLSTPGGGTAPPLRFTSDEVTNANLAKLAAYLVLANCSATLIKSKPRRPDRTTVCAFALSGDPAMDYNWQLLDSVMLTFGILPMPFTAPEPEPEPAEEPAGG